MVFFCGGEMLHIGSFPIFRSNYNLLSFCIFCLILRKMCVSKCTCFPSLILSNLFQHSLWEAQPLLAISLNCPIARTSTKALPTSLQDWMLDHENQPLWRLSATPQWAWDLFHSFMFLVSGIPWWRLQADWTEQEMSVAFDNRTDGYSITGADVKSKAKLCH